MDIGPLKDAYWEIIAECLELFHGYSAEHALLASQDLRAAVESIPAEDDPPYVGELFYHREPFEVACGVAGRNLEVGERWAEYDALAMRHYAPAEARICLPVPSSYRQSASV